MIVLVTGAFGRLGSTISRQLNSKYRVVALGHSELDLTHHAEVMDIVRDIKPEIILNCAAYNDVDGAENEPSKAFAVNAFGVRTLACAAHYVDATLVHYSTGFVFDGKTSEPYSEEAATNPQNVYAMSKLLGEWFTQDARSYVLRVESLFGGDGHQKRESSVDRMADALIEGRNVEAFSDRMVSPSYADDVVTATVSLLTTCPAVGVYHCVGSGMATWLQIANELARCFNRSSKIIPISVNDKPLKAKRPKFCVLSNAKLAKVGIEMPNWKDAVKRYVRNRLEE